MPSWLPATGAERILWLAIILLVGGYLLGQTLNRNRSKRTGAWIQAGLGALGGRVAWRWAKTISAGAEVTVDEARAPFRSLVISYYLLTREFPPLWLWEQLRGRRDLLSLRADLRLQPGHEFEILPLQGRLRKKLDTGTAELAAGTAYAWHELEHGLGLAMRGEVDPEMVTRAKAFLGDYGPHIERVSLRRRKPHVMLFLRLTGIERTKSDALWRALGELVR